MADVDDIVRGLTIEELARHKAVNRILGELLAPLIPDLIERIEVGNRTCSLILASLSTPTDGEKR